MGTPDHAALQDRGLSILMRWRIRLLVAACLIALLGMYWPTTAALSELWLDTDKTTFTHGFIVLAIAFWLILRDERFEFLGADRPSLFGALAYVSCSIGWLIAYRASIETAHELALPVLGVLAAYALFGKSAARLAAFPISFLIFAIPIWDVLTPYLQTVSAVMVGHMLHLTGIDAYVDGSFVHIGVGTFEIAGGCSGLHFVMVGLALGALYGELGRDSIKTRASLIALAFFIAVAANWVRVYVIVIAGYLTNMQHYLVRVEHYRFGWAVFAVMMALFFWIASRFPSGVQPSLALDEIKAPVTGRWNYAYAALGFVLIPGWNVLAPSRASPPPTEDQMHADFLPPTWKGPLQTGDPTWNPVFAGADVQRLFGYQSADGTRVSLYVAAYRRQKQDEELVGYYNHLISDSDNIIESRAISRGTHEYVTENRGARDVTRFSYWIGDLQTGSGFVAQLAYGVKSLWSAPLSRVVALRTSCSSDCDAARRTLDSFESTLEPNPVR
jgi:exosortase A